MAYELWAIDAEAGEALLHEEDRWYLTSMERGWRCEELESPQGCVQWCLSSHVVPVHRNYSTRDEAVTMARQICRAAWNAKSFSTDEIHRLLTDIQAGQAQRRNRTLWPEINTAALLLDGYFEEQGCTEEESLKLIVLTLDKLRESEWWAKPESDLYLILQRFARAVYRETRAQSEHRSFEQRLFFYDRMRLASVLERLPLEALEILTTWAGSSYSQEEVAIVVHGSLADVLKVLRMAAEATGRSADELRTPEFAELCRETARTR